MFLIIKLCTHAKTELFEIELTTCIKMDLALNNLQRLICHKTQTTNLPQSWRLFCTRTLLGRVSRLRCSFRGLPVKQQNKFLRNISTIKMSKLLGRVKLLVRACLRRRISHRFRGRALGQWHSKNIRQPRHLIVQYGSSSSWHR